MAKGGMPVFRKVTGLLDRVWDYLVPHESPTTVGAGTSIEDRPQVLNDVEKARREWEAARIYFDHVTDPDLIDHAIYTIEASERKYMYLLRKAHKLGYSIDGPSSLRVSGESGSVGRLEEARPL